MSEKPMPKLWWTPSANDIGSVYADYGADSIWHLVPGGTRLNLPADAVELAPVAEADQLRARVAELTEALTRIKNFGHGYSGCPGDRWCSVCTARAALAAGAAPTEGGGDV